MASVATTAEAGDGPALLTVIVYVTFIPVPYGGAEGAFAIDRSADAGISASATRTPSG